MRDGAEKSFGSDEIIDIVRKIQAHGIRVMGNYIFGLPDDTHESMLHSRWMYTLGRMEAFLTKFLGGGAPSKITTAGK